MIHDYANISVPFKHFFLNQKVFHDVNDNCILNKTVLLCYVHIAIEATTPEQR